MIQSPSIDQDEALLFLLGSYPATRDNPDKYISKNQQANATPTNSNGIMPNNTPGGLPQNGQNGPQGANMGRKPVSAQGAMGKIMGAAVAQRRPAMNAV